MHKTTVNQIEEALRLHINFAGIPSGGRYLRIMDRLAWNYSGEPVQKVSALLDDYFNAVGVKNLTEAFDRLRELDSSSN